MSRKIVNATDHPITFELKDGTLITLPPHLKSEGVPYESATYGLRGDAELTVPYGIPIGYVRYDVDDFPDPAEGTIYLIDEDLMQIALACGVNRDDLAIPIEQISRPNGMPGGGGHYRAIGMLGDSLR